MGLMDMFRTNATSDAPPPATNQPPASTASNAPPGGVGSDGKMPGSNQEPVNPLDAYAKLWDTAGKADPDVPPAFTIDPKVLSEVSSTLDFTQGIPAETMTAAMTGDSKALMEVIKLSGQQAYKAALHHNTSLTDKFINARSQFDSKQLGSNVRKELTNSALDAIPNASHPVIKAQLKMTADAMAAANPDARPEEIAKAAQQYVLDLAKAMNPETKDTGAEKGGEIDWAQYMQS